jgi:hypothetical protein
MRRTFTAGLAALAIGVGLLATASISGASSWEGAGGQHQPPTSSPWQSHSGSGGGGVTEDDQSGISGTDGFQGVTPDGRNGYCAVTPASGVACWGYGGDGELGNGTTANSATPVAVVGVGGTGTLIGVRSVVSDGTGFCAILWSGRVDCWGLNSGALGNGSTANSATPVAVEGVGGTGLLGGVRSMTSYGLGYCALLNYGGVNCWGFNGDGELGNGATTDSASPVAVVGVGGTGVLDGVRSIVSDANYSTCAIRVTGGVYCWGFGGNGELGGTTATSSATPVAVVGVGGTGSLNVGSLDCDDHAWSPASGCGYPSWNGGSGASDH